MAQMSWTMKKTVQRWFLRWKFRSLLIPEGARWKEYVLDRLKHPSATDPYHGRFVTFDLLVNPEKHSVIINSFVVNGEYQSRGVGTAVIREILSNLPNHYVLRISMVRYDNLAMQGLMRKLGFRPTSPHFIEQKQSTHFISPPVSK